MKESDEEYTLIRQYLLGALDEAARLRLEERVITDQDYKDTVLVAEDELIEDYLEGALSEAERKSFSTHFLSVPQQRQRVRIARAIDKYVNPEPIAATAQAHLPWWRKLSRLLHLNNPLISIPVAALLCIALLLGALKAIQNWRPQQQQLTQKQLQRLQVEQELESINGPSNVNPTMPVIPMLLTPGLRSDGTSAKLARPANPQIIRLQLLLTTTERYASYQTLIKKLDDEGEFSIGKLQEQTTGRGREVPVNIQTKFLARGDYQVKLSGLTTGGALEEIGNYQFRVTE